MRVARESAPVELADQKVSDNLNHKRDSWQMRLVGTASDIGDQPQMRLLCAATIVLAMVRRDSQLAKTGFKMIAAHTVATWGKSRVKAIVDRTRPDGGDDPKLRLGGSDAHEETSFPSGHSAGVVGVAQVVARSYPEHALAARSAAFVVAAVQVPRGTHYVGDVVAGALIGLLAEQATDAAWSGVSRAADREDVDDAIDQPSRRTQLQASPSGTARCKPPPAATRR